MNQQTGEACGAGYNVVPDVHRAFKRACLRYARLLCGPEFGETRDFESMSMQEKLTLGATLARHGNVFGRWYCSVPRGEKEMLELTKRLKNIRYCGPLTDIALFQFAAYSGVYEAFKFQVRVSGSDRWDFLESYFKRGA